MKHISFIIALGLTVSLFSFSANAEDLNQIFGRVNKYVSDKNYPKAMEELGWARKEIEKLNNDQLKSFFPDELAGYKGLKLETNSVFGINNVERAYKGKDGSEIKVSLTGGTGGAGAGAGFGQLAALGGMAAMMQGQNDGSETFRLDGRTANLQLEEGGGSGELTVFLNSGSILKLEMSNKATSDALKGFAGAIKVNELDSYLGGSR